EYFPDLSPYDLGLLAEDIQRNGLRHKIEVLPVNKAGLAGDTVLDGHQRWRALLLNGETQVQVIVRYDLAATDRATVEGAFLEPNRNRRQLSPLGKARVALRLYEIEIGRRRDRFLSIEEGEARDRVGKTVGMCGRNLARYVNVLRTPAEVQEAFEQ